MVQRFFYGDSEEKKDDNPKAKKQFDPVQKRTPSWAWLPPLPSCAQVHISLEFVTREQNGVIFFSGDTVPSQQKTSSHLTGVSKKEQFLPKKRRDVFGKLMRKSFQDQEKSNQQETIQEYFFQPQTTTNNYFSTQSFSKISGKMKSNHDTNQSVSSDRYINKKDFEAYNRLGEYESQISLIYLGSREKREYLSSKTENSFRGQRNETQSFKRHKRTKVNGQTTTEFYRNRSKNLIKNPVFLKCSLLPKSQIKKAYENNEWKFYRNSLEKEDEINAERKRQRGFKNTDSKIKNLTLSERKPLRLNNYLTPKTLLLKDQTQIGLNKVKNFHIRNRSKLKRSRRKDSRSTPLKKQEFIILRLIEGKPRLALNFGEGNISLSLSSSSVSLSDFHWHRIDIIWRDQVRLVLKFNAVR